MDDASIQPFEQGPKKLPALPPLSKEEAATAARLAKELVRSEEHLDDIVTFGSDSQDAAAQITKDMLAGVRVGTLEDVLQMSDSVLAEVHSLDVGDLLPTPRRLLWLFRETAAMIVQRVRNFFRRYELVNTRLDRQEAVIFSKERDYTDRFHRDKALFELSLKTWKDAQTKAAAVDIFLAGEHGCPELDRRLSAVASERQAAQAEGRPLNYPVLVAADRQSKYVERLELRRSALKALMASTYQMSFALRPMQENEDIIRQKLNDIRTLVLPQWRMMIAIAYQAYQQHEIAQVIRDLEEAEARLRRQTADRVEKSVEEMAELMVKPTIDIASMKYYQDKLIDSLNTLKTASIEARKARAAAEKELQDLVGRMGDAAAGIAQRTQ